MKFTFAENMKRFTEELKQTTKERGTFVTEVKVNTAQFLSDARSKLEEISKENRTQAQELRNHLATTAHERQEQVKHMRQEFVQELGELRKELQTVLGDAHKQRHEAVNGILGAALSTRLELAGDLREASRLWQEHRKN
jgi:uncharacterized membrane protein